VTTLQLVGDAQIPHLSLPIDDLEKARVFYVDVLGCRLGRVREDWFDVWFFGMQLTLQCRPKEVKAQDQQGARHFGVVLTSKQGYDDLVARVNAAGVEWISPPSVHSDLALSGKIGGKLADPSGNVIEVKYYDEIDELLS
jgi:extradiol dioxygenase family protein